MSVLNVFNFWGRMCLLLLATAGFYFGSNDYFFVGGKMIDFSLLAWGGMFALWGSGIGRAYKRKKPELLMFAVAMTLSAAAFDCCRFLMYAADLDCFLYIRIIVAVEIVFALAAAIVRCRAIFDWFLGSIVLSYFGTVLIYPQMCPLSYIYAVAGVYALLWGVSYRAKEKAAYRAAVAGLAGLVLLVGGLSVLFYSRTAGIRFYEAKVTEPAKDVKVSVVIPVYNAEGVIERCLDSLRKQTLKDIEIIAVDDGSTDGTPAILAQYAAHDARIKVIRQENAYIGAARNRGLRAAQGEYVGFVDSDDYVSPDYYEELYKKAKKTNADAVITHSVQEASQSKSFFARIEGKKKKFKGEYSGDLFDYGKYSGFVWTKIYKKSFLMDNNIRFATERTIYEDTFFSMIFWMYLKDLPIAEKGTYYHTVRERLTETSSKGKIKDELFEMLQHLKGVIENAPIDVNKKAKVLETFDEYPGKHLKNLYHNLAEEEQPMFKERCLNFFAEEDCLKAMEEYRELTDREQLESIQFDE